MNVNSICGKSDESQRKFIDISLSIADTTEYYLDLWYLGDWNKLTVSIE